MPGNQFVMRFWITAAFMALAALSGVEAQQTLRPLPTASGADYCSGVEKEAFRLINQYRRTSELAPLAWDDSIAEVARAHSREMATGKVDFGHDGFSDRVTRLKTVMTEGKVKGAGENVFMSDGLDQVARFAVREWLQSPRHLENIRGDFNYSGLGVWQNADGTIYFTQIFLKIVPTTAEAEASPPSTLTPFGMLAAPNTGVRR